ncbi:uncharacterized protein [Diabrotica undecimpunctata]|uniref:uncharacterized protein n=1 Tax=Diabrotica undecimpunctata TaxID=50387 RepID=UPI003B63F867
MEVVHSTILYAAPVWQQVINIKKYRRMFEKAQREVLYIALVARVYKTTSTVVIQVITGVLPIHLMVKERAETYGKNKQEKIVARNRITDWCEEWTKEHSVACTRVLIPNIADCLPRKNREGSGWKLRRMWSV